MAKTEEIPTSSDDTLLALVTSIKSLTLALEGKNGRLELKCFPTLTLQNSEHSSNICSAGVTDSSANCACRYTR